MTKSVLLTAFLLFGWTTSTVAGPTEMLKYGRFGNIRLYAARGPGAAVPLDVALMLSGEAGWNAREEALADHLAGLGTLVVGIDSREYFEQLAGAAEKCVTPSAELENLSHFVQSAAQLKTYIEPVLVGYDGGGALAYAALAEAPEGLLRGAVSIGFCPDLKLRKPLCTNGDSSTPVRLAADGSPSGISVLPSKSLPGKWVVLQTDTQTACAINARKFMNRVPGGELVSITRANAEYVPNPDWLPEFDVAFRRASLGRKENTHHERRATAIPSALADLPLIIVPAAHPGTTPWFGIFLTGDGGWVGLDKGVSNELANHDIPIVGWDSLKYFWSKRTPDGTSADLDRVIRYYAAAWSKSHVLLIGYSQGADTMPFMINRLPPATHALVGFTTLLGISDNAVFEFHVANWVGNSSGGIPTAPELAHWTGAPYLCLYGESDADAACQQLTGPGGEALKLSGGHHFGGGYGHIAGLIMQRLPDFNPGKLTP